MTTTTPEPTDVPTPPGVTHIDGWYAEDRPYRFLYGRTRTVARPAGNGSVVKPDVLVGAIAAQLADGAIDDGSVIDSPKVFVELRGDDALTTAQARQVARALMAAADDLDGWTDD